MPERRRVLVTLRNRDAFDSVYTGGGANGAIWIGEVQASVGERVEVELVFVAELMIFHVRGIVDFADPERGLRVCLDTADSKARDVILNFVRGEDLGHVTRRARRFSVRLGVQWADGGEFHPGLAVDISGAGAAVRSQSLPAKGSLVVIKFPSEDLVVRAEVAWCSSDEPSGFGVMFIAGEQPMRERLDAFIRKVLEARPVAM
ncbi:MAG: PilZ domain-containing protein [Myxococcota bacterium]